MISVGKGDAIIQVLPTALRFWEKLGLGPRGGRKDVVAFVLFEADCEERIQQVEGWLACVSATYNVRSNFWWSASLNHALLGQTSWSAPSG
jgi:mediator of RNA polymerase II transcription subunit 13